jgi:dihydrofolate reductase
MVGRRMFDLGFGPWGDEPPFHLPVFVLTHRLRDPILMRGGTTYHFVSGVESALEAAKAAAHGRDIAIEGGADVIQQYIGAGLVDELRIHLVPLLLGSGTRFFAAAGPRSDLEVARAIEGPGVTHLTFRFTRPRHGGK